MKILLATEEFSQIPNEGLLVFVSQLASYLNQKVDLTIVCSSFSGKPLLNCKTYLSIKFAINFQMLKLLNTEKFDLLIYIPASGFTAGGFLRSLLLKIFSKTKTILIALQNRNMGFGHKLLSSFLSPDLVLSPVLDIRQICSRLGVKNGFISPGFDNAKFVPVSREVKLSLREKYNIPKNKYIILHAGHIRKSRNLDMFNSYDSWGENIQPVIVGGFVDNRVKEDLLNRGIIVIDNYLEHIQEIYQAADCYLFPVKNQKGCLDIPLSILEAAGCNLPIITTRFGSLAKSFDTGQGLFFFERAEEIPVILDSAKSDLISTKQLFSEYSWVKVFDKYIQPHLFLD